MLFNSLEFLIFLPLVYFGYWYLFREDFQKQNKLLLLCSYIFYGWWDWRFVFLLFFSTYLDYFVGLRLEKITSQKKKLTFLWLSIGINLGFLAIFKYYNFFAENLGVLFGKLGWHVDPFTLSIVLPVGISFYTFHGISYVIDIYYGKTKATKDFFSYGLFVSYFPLLVAGPIERGYHLLPQIEKKRYFSRQQTMEGLKLIIQGLFKKVVIADSFGPLVNHLFEAPEQQSGGSLALAALAFSFQIYGDFSGYTDIARGISKLFGMELLLNFNYPYLSRNIPEFWRKWHISLSSWFRDYVYIPLGGSRVTKPKAIRNVFIIFILSGFWHGANWTFLAWGFIHALLFLPTFLMGKNRQYVSNEWENDSWYPSIKETGQIIMTFALVTVAWIFFRAPDIQTAGTIVFRIFSSPFHWLDGINTMTYKILFIKGIIGLILLFWGTTLMLRKQENKWYYLALGLSILFLNSFRNTADFIYFQF